MLAAISAMRASSARGEGRRSGWHASQARIAARIWSSAQTIGIEDVLNRSVLGTAAAFAMGHILG
jgi:hypothetical protein